ncbi:MAG: branched-chain amino acid ABC transporter permease [Actinobacteria bacterium]|nr:branched-chain amino acid ABC transporter permease [Actinomycetota bacterium]
MNPTITRGIFDVLSLSSVLILLVIGMAIIVGMMKVFNMCQGELILLGAVTAFLCSKYLGNIWLGIFLAPLIVGIFGFFLERTIIHRFYVNPQAALLATFAIGLIIRETLRTRMNTQGAPVAPPIENYVEIGGTNLPVWRVVIIAVTLVLTLTIAFVLLKTNLGMKVRATLDNPELVSVSGISTKWMYACTYAIGAALSGFAGAMIVPLQTLYPNLGYDNLILMFIAVLVGGLGQFSGPIIGAAIIASTGALLGQFISPVTGQIMVVLFAVVLTRLRPAGILKGGR